MEAIVLRSGTQVARQPQKLRIVRGLAFELAGRLLRCGVLALAALTFLVRPGRKSAIGGWRSCQCLLFILFLGATSSSIEAHVSIPRRSFALRSTSRASSASKKDINAKIVGHTRDGMVPLRAVDRHCRACCRSDVSGRARLEGDRDSQREQHDIASRAYLASRGLQCRENSRARTEGPVSACLHACGQDGAARLRRACCQSCVSE